MIHPSRMALIRNNRRLFFGGMAVLIALVIGVTLFMLSQLQDAAEKRFQSASLVLAKSLEQTLHSQIDAINFALQVSASEIARRQVVNASDPKAISDFLDRQQEQLQNVVFLRATNDQGEVIYGSSKLSVRPNISDRNYFAMLRDDPSAGMVISPPIVSRTNQQWIWLFARRINRLDGSFAGVVYAAMTVDAISRTFAQLNLQHGNIVSLYNEDMQLVARFISPDKYDHPGNGMGLSARLVDAMKENPYEGQYVDKNGSLVDGVTRNHAYRRNAKYGFLVVVGISSDVIFAVWRQQAFGIGGFALAFILVLIASAVLVSRGWRRQEKNLVALEDSQELLKDAQKIASISSYRYDLHTDRWVGTGAIREILGLESDFQNDSHGWMSLIAPEYREVFHARLSAAVEQGIPFSDEYQVISPKDGQKRFVHHQARAEVDADGKVVSIFGTIQDITERKRSEDALRESHEVLHSILETTMDGVWCIDSEGQILDVNQAFCEMSGYTRDELLKMHVSDVEAMETPIDGTNRFQYIVNHGRAQFEARQYRKDGTIWDIEVSATFRDVHGGQVVAFMRDITQRKQIEQELHQMATTDVLTGVFNRRHFMFMAKIEHRRALRLEQELALVLVDIDHFKQINDRFGHAAGDRAMLLLVDVFRANIRQIDILARLGGDEFVLLLPGSSAEHAVDVMERVRDAMALHQVVSEEAVFQITISAGVSCISSDEDKLDMLLARADQALYESKERGRNRVSMA